MIRLTERVLVSKRTKIGTPVDWSVHLAEPSPGQIQWCLLSTYSVPRKSGTQERELWQLSTPSLCGGLVFNERRICIRSAPILKQAIGKHLQELLTSCAARNYTFQFVCLFYE